jgi:mannose/fructose-specific phosphotransferase system component IIA
MTTSPPPPPAPLVKQPRTAVLVVTHGDAGEAMLDEIRRLLGDGAILAMAALAVVHGQDRNELHDRIATQLGTLDEGRGTLVLVDLQGSTPCNQSVVLKREGQNIEILCGLSLPMLLKIAASDRARLSLGELAHEAAQTAIRSIRLGDGGAP